MTRRKLALSLAFFVIGLASPALGVTPPYPNRPNISMDVSPGRHSVLIYVVNMTKYQMALASYGDQEFQGMYVDAPIQSGSYRGFVFAPGGIPTLIPPVKGGFSDPTREVYCSAKPFVFVWQDAGSSKTAFPYMHLVYTLSNVDAPGATIADRCGNTGTPGPVNIMIELDRVKTGPPSLKSEIFETIVTGTKALVELGEFLVEGNPIAFVMFLDETYNFVGEVKTVNAEAGNVSDTAYFNSYAEACNNDLSLSPAFVTHPAVGGENDPQQDGVATQQADTNGNPQSNLVVAQYLVRENDPTDGTFSGRIPTLVVIFMTKADWAAGTTMATAPGKVQMSRGATNLASQVQRGGVNGKRNLLQLVRSMPGKDVQSLILAYKDMRANKKPSEQQETLIASLNDALARHATSMAPPPSSSKH